MASRLDAAKPVTVRELLELRRLKDAHVLGGTSGLGRTVADVVLVSVGDRADLSLPGQALVIASGATLLNDTYQVDLLLRRISDQDGSGLVLLAPASRLGMATTRLASKLDLPLIIVESPDAFTLTDELRRVVVTPGMVVSSLVLEATASLASASQRGVAEVVDCLGHLLNAESSLVGAESQTVAGKPLAFPLESRDQLPVPLAGSIDDETFQVIHPVVLAPKERPSFWLVLRRQNPTSGWVTAARHLTQIAAWSIGTRLIADRLQHERDARFRLGVLSAIVGSGEAPEPALVEQMGVLGWQADGWCTGVHIKASGEVDPVRILVLTAEVAQALTAVGVDSPVVERPDGWTLWTLEDKEPRTRQYAALTQAIQQTVTRLTTSHPTVVLHVGIGRPYRSVSGLRHSLSEAHEASTIAYASGAGSAVHHIDELGVKRILLGWYASETFAEFASTLLYPIVDDDPSGRLLETLEAYLDCESSPTETAARLGVHRNTVIKRVERFRDLLSVDLDDAEGRLAIQLACRVNRLKESGR